MKNNKTIRIRVINPNTSERMTRDIEKVARQCARPDTEISVVCPQFGPEVIESIYDKYMAAPALLQEEAIAIKEGYDGIVIACFGDTALDASREIADIPVVGISEAAMFMACMLGNKFSVLSIIGGAEIPVRERLSKYGLEKRCASIRAKDIGVLNFEKNKESAVRDLIGLGKKAVAEDRCDVIILGCAGMAGLDAELEKELGVPVIDPVVAGVKMLEAIIDAGEKPGKRPSSPSKKAIKGYPDYMQTFAT